MADYNPTGKPRTERNRIYANLPVIKPGTEYYGDPIGSTAIAGGVYQVPEGGIADSPIKFNNDVADITSGLFDLLIKKHADYGPKNISQSPGGPLNGLRVRMWDKIARINNLIDSGATPENESLIDSYRDLANYSIIAIMVLEGKWPNE
jgi:hypothetical protein